MAAGFSIEQLQPTHPRKSFSSGVAVLDRYLHELATQDVRRRVSNCFVACADDGAVAAYYTFAATSLPLTDLPPEETRKLPRYGVLPAGLIGRLAVDQRFHRQGLGGALIVDAARRAANSDPAIFALVVDAKDEGAVVFYQRFGFRPFASRPLSLYLPLSTILKAMDEGAG